MYEMESACFSVFVCACVCVCVCVFLSHICILTFCKVALRGSSLVSETV